MSAGLFRKQYTALSALADNLGVDYTDPEGSFNQKFCALCAIMIEDQGGTFEAVQGSFHTRKSIYLWQLATALNLTIATSGNTFLKSAFAIWEEYSDGTAPDDGASLDWRVYQFLLHATEVGPPDQDNLVQWLTYLKEDGITLNDKLEVIRPEPTLVGVSVITTDGVSEYVTTGVEPTAVSRFRVRMRFLNTTGCLSGHFGGSSNRFYFGTNAGFFTASSQSSLIPTTKVADTEWHTFEHSAKNGTFSIDGEDLLSGLDFSTFTGNAVEYWYGSRAGATPGYYATEVAEVWHYEDDVLQGHVCFEHTAGDIGYDLSGKGNDLGVSTASWGQSDGTGSLNHSRGFSKYEFITLLLSTVPPLDLVPVLTQIPV